MSWKLTPASSERSVPPAVQKPSWAAMTSVSGEPSVRSAPGRSRTGLRSRRGWSRRAGNVARRERLPRGAVSERQHARIHQRGCRHVGVVEAEQTLLGRVEDAVAGVDARVSVLYGQGELRQRRRLWGRTR